MMDKRHILVHECCCVLKTLKSLDAEQQWLSSAIAGRHGKAVQSCVEFEQLLTRSAVISLLQLYNRDALL